MNFLDAYDVSGTSTPREGPEPTLNEEVTQVVGQLSRLWGGFRKQSQTVLESARKDLSQVVSQAQKELTKLTSEEPNDPSSSNATSDDTATAGESSTAGPSAAASPDAAPPSEGSSSSADETPGTPTSENNQRQTHARGASVSVAAQNLFTRIQASLPANLASTVQAQIPESIRQGTGSIDFGQLRTTLATEFQRVQGVTRAQAEEYVHKSEELFREAGEFLKDAVKVVPPEEGQGNPGVLWDGTDVWMLPNMSSGSADSKGKGRERSADGRSSGEVLRAGATRAEALLKQLRHDPEVIRVDPETDQRVRDIWKKWVKREVDSQEHGILSEKWTAAVQKALSDEDGDALQNTMEVLVPSAMPSEMFWTRYFFRVYQVEVEEERRKALIEGTTESEEDINWESDDDDETANSPAGGAAAPEPQPKSSRPPRLDASRETVIAAKASVASTPATESPRLSSEDSYDVVSSQVSNAGDAKPAEGEKKDNADDDDESDWE